MTGRIRRCSCAAPAALLGIVLALAAPARASADSWIVTVSPLYSLPLTAQADVFSPLSVGGSLSAVLPFALGVGWLHPALGAGYVYSGLAASASSLSAIEAQAGVQARFSVVPWMDAVADLSLRGGYYMLGGGGQTASGFSPGVSLDAGADFRLGDTFSVGLGAQGVYDLGMYFYLRPFLSASVRLGGGGAGGSGGPAAPAPQQQAPPPKPAPLVGQKPAEPAAPAVETISFDSSGVFPVFYKFYEDHPFGTVTVTNNGKVAWTDVRVTFSMKQFMDLPATLPPVASIPAGQAVKIDLVSLFNDSILSVTEATRISGELTVEYKENGKPARLSRTVALRVFDRNAMIWDDDQRAAAFVTAKDPLVLSLAKSLAGDLSAARNPALSERFQVAAGIHDALVLYGVNYVKDPTSVFSGAKSKAEIDFLQFPRQTLEYRSGDCDDLSILYAAFFEAVGIETAFITVPGHIYVAVSLDLSPEDARTRFGRFDDLIFRDGKTWLPIEITLRKGGFLAAWAEAARDWRENSSRGTAAFVPVHAAWAQYEPVALPGSSSLAPMPSARAVQAMQADVVSFVQGEIAERAARLQADSRKAQGASKAINALGVLYAQYGLYDKAKTQFESVLAKEEYVPALVNLGNLRRTQGDLDGALAFYDRAYKKAPSSASVLLAEAVANHQLENYGAVKRYYQALKAANPAMADRYAYLDLRGEEGARAADAAGLKNQIDWMEDR